MALVDGALFGVASRRLALIPLGRLVLLAVAGNTCANALACQI